MHVCIFFFNFYARNHSSAALFSCKYHYIWCGDSEVSVIWLLCYIFPQDSGLSRQQPLSSFTCHCFHLLDVLHTFIGFCLSFLSPYLFECDVCVCVCACVLQCSYFLPASTNHLQAVRNLKPLNELIYSLFLLLSSPVLSYLLRLFSSLQWKQNLV